MIRSFRDKDTERLFNGEYTKKWGSALARKAVIKMLLIDSAQTINDLRMPPSNHLEKLVGDRVGQYSIRVNKQWRICFVWEDGDAAEIELTDYH